MTLAIVLRAFALLTVAGDFLNGFMFFVLMAVRIGVSTRFTLAFSRACLSGLKTFAVSLQTVGTFAVADSHDSAGLYSSATDIRLFGLTSQLLLHFDRSIG